MVSVKEGVELLVQSVEAFVAPELVEPIKYSVSSVLQASSTEARGALLAQLMSTGNGWGYFPPNALAREINFSIGKIVVDASSNLAHPERIPREPERPLVYLANHLSFSDANLFAYLLARDGSPELASRLCVLTGPKVFTDPFRRFSSLSFGAIKLPQSPSRASGEALMPRREVARLATQTIISCKERLNTGDHLLVFVEGTRSRSAAMQPALAAVSRYLELPGTQLVPLAITGSEALVPIGEEHAHKTRVEIQIGEALCAEQLFKAADHNRGLVMHTIGLAISKLLPAPYRGYYGAPLSPELAQAAELLKSLSP